MTYCKVPQAEIFYEDLGKGTPIIMVHGFSPDHRLMRGCMEPIFTEADNWRRLYLDLPGMGFTKNVQVTSSDEMLEAVYNFIQTIIPNQKYLIIGESYGGYIARGLIDRNPEQVLGAAFICPVIFPYPENRTVEEHQVLRMDKKFTETLSKEELEDFQSHHVVLSKEIWTRYNEEILSGCKIANEKALNEVIQNYGFSFSIDQHDFMKPSLFLLGKQDSTVGYKDTLELIQKFPRGTFAVLDMAGHNLQIEQPQIFHSLMKEWLQRVEAFL